MLFPVATPARVIALSENRKDKEANTSCGPSSLEPSMSPGQVGWLMKTFGDQFRMASLTGKSMSSKVLATPAGRPLLFLQVSLEPHTAEREFGWLPTPLRDDYKGGSDAPRKDNGKLRLDQLRHWYKIKTGLSYPNPDFYRVMMGYPDGWMRSRDMGTQ